MIKEVWRPVFEYEGLYEVSDLGNVRSVDRTVVCKNGRKQFWKGMMLKPWKNKKGYRQVNLSKDGIEKPTLVHPLVARAFPEICGEWFEGCVVDHIIPVSMGGTDEATNLRVCTIPQNNNNPITKQNMSEAHKGKFGAEHPKSKPVLQYSKDGNLFREWDSIADAVRELGIAQPSISRCCSGKLKSTGGYIWKHKEKEA